MPSTLPMSFRLCFRFHLRFRIYSITHFHHHIRIRSTEKMHGSRSAASGVIRLRKAPNFDAIDQSISWTETFFVRYCAANLISPTSPPISSS
jgi:hypothetical protein